MSQESQAENAHSRLDGLESDQPPTEVERVEWLRERFEFERMTLLLGKAHILDRPDWWLAFDALEHLAALLKKGRATQEMQALLADYLTKYVLDQDVKTPFAILGLPQKDGRKTKELERIRAIDAYEVRIKAGESDEQALAAAWQAYLPDKDIAAESKRAAGEGSNAYSQSLKTIKRILHRARVRKPDPAGRPKKSSKKP